MKDEEILLKRAIEKLEVAKDLLRENHFSDSVSRAYYGMLFSARALLSKLGETPKTHKGTITRFAQKFVKTGKIDKNLFQYFARTQEDREEADYGLFPEITKEEAEEVLKNAEKFVENCEKVLKKL